MPSSTLFASRGHRCWTLLAALLVTAYAFWAYCNCYAGPFVFDDVPLIVENPQLLAYWPATSFGPRRLVGHWTFAFNRQRHGLNPVGYHFVNVAIHAASAVMLFWLVRHTLRLPVFASRHARQATFLALAVALVWAVHPLQTGAVTYIVQRLESLAGLFYLLFLYAMARRAHGHFGWTLLALVACLAGMLTKEIMLTAPVVALLYDRAFLASTWRTVLEKRGLLHAVCLLPTLWLCLNLLTDASSGDNASMGFGMESITPWRYCISQGPVLLHYVRLAIWPDQLCLDYAWRPALSLSEVWLADLVVGAAFVASVAAYMRWPRYGFLPLAWFVILSPTSSVIPLADLAFEHRMYLPLALMTTAAVLGTRSLLRGVLNNRWMLLLSRSPYSRAALRTAILRGQTARRVAAVALLHFTSQALLMRTLARNSDYGTEVKLWTSTLAVVPHNPRVKVNLGGALYMQGEYERARAHLENSLQTWQTPEAHLYLGLIDQRQHDFAAAERHFRQALELRPESSRVFDCLGELNAAQGNSSEAEGYFRAAIERDANYAPAYIHLAKLLDQTHRTAEGTEWFERGLALAPDLPAALSYGAWRMSTGSDARVHAPARALQFAQQLERHWGDRLAAEQWSAVAAAYFAQGDLSRAIEAAQRAVDKAKAEKLSPELPSLERQLEEYRRNRDES